MWGAEDGHWPTATNSWSSQTYSPKELTAASSVQFSYSVMPNSLLPHEQQHARPPCPSPIPRVYPNPCPLSRWCHLTISSSIVRFSSCPQSFPASGSFQMSQLFTSGGQKYWSFSFNISLSIEHSGLISFRIDWVDLLAVQRTLYLFIFLITFAQFYSDRKVI